MPARRPAETTPDLFSAKPTVKAPERPEGKTAASQPRHFLPKDLAGALKRLDDTEIDTLLGAVTTEAAHRGRLPAGAAAETPIDPRQQRGQARAEHDAGSLTTGKLNA